VGPVSLIADARFQARLRWNNVVRWDLYLSVNAIEPGRRARTRDAIAAIRHVFLDADHDGAQVLATLASRRDVPRPSYVVQSSPNRIHILWRASGFTCDAVEALQKRLARELATDPAATSCTQMTRLPGFVSHKRPVPHLVTIDYRDAVRTYTPADFPPPALAVTVSGPDRHRAHLRVSPDHMGRARQYVAAVPPAIAGQHGDVQTFRLCCRLVRGFALADADALVVLAPWNARCEPPWSERELVEKLRRARRYGREPVGGLLT
jgi:hypothetical protein